MTCINDVIIHHQYSSVFCHNQAIDITAQTNVIGWESQHCFYWQMLRGLLVLLQELFLGSLVIHGIHTIAAPSSTHHFFIDGIYLHL